MKPALSYICLCSIITILVSGCRPSESSSSITDFGTIVCEVFYRPSAGGGFEEAPATTFAGGYEEKDLRFENMSFHAGFQDDQYEGRALSVAVTDLETGADISRQLYQFDPQNPPENQFIGGHGFSGLQYVFHPDSGAEIQYFCSVK